MALRLTLSCDLNQSESGPTLIHSTGVQHYRIPPEVIRTLQDTLTNDVLSDHEQGVLCQVGPQRVLAALRGNGFKIEKQTTDTDRALWTLTQGSGGDHVPAVPQPVTPANEDEGEKNEDEAQPEGEGEGEGEGEEEGEEEPEE